MRKLKSSIWIAALLTLSATVPALANPAGAGASGTHIVSAEPQVTKWVQDQQAEEIEWREMQTEGPAMVYLPHETAGYIFPADFSERDMIESDRLYITGDTILKAENLGSAKLSMYEALPMGGERLIFDNEDYLETHSLYISVPVQAGRIYFFRLEKGGQEDGNRHGIYVRAQEKEGAE